LAKETKAVVAYQSDLGFNRVSNPTNTNPDGVIYSIDVSKIQKIAQSDDLAALHQITLACRPARDGFGLWDMFFNSSQYRSSTATIMVAQHNFEPVPRERVTSWPSYLRFTHSSIRTHLNKLVKGDWVGIAIGDTTAGFTYVLLYEVEDSLRIRMNAGAGELSSIVVPSVNATMHYALRLDHADSGSADILCMGEREYDHEMAGSFVARLTQSVMDLSTAYAWKPHFLPVQPASFKRKVIEEKLAPMIANATQINYAAFEDLCRAAYEEQGKNQPRHPAQPPQPAGPRKKKAPTPPPVLPIIDVVSVGDTFYAIVPGVERMVSFKKDDMGSDYLAERHLTNRDLNKSMITENSLVMVLSPSFGEDAYLRYFSVNF
jgi:hypothetical protein